MSNPVTEIGNRIVHGKKEKFTVDYIDFKSRTGQLMNTKEFNNEQDLVKWVRSNSVKQHIQVNKLSADAKKAIHKDLKPPTFFEVASSMVKEEIENVKKIVNKFKKDKETNVVVENCCVNNEFEENKPSLTLIKS